MEFIETWQRNHGQYLAQVNRHARVVAVEGFVNRPLGASVPLRWSDLGVQRGHYDTLMHDAARAGFARYFTEVDARDDSRVEMDSEDNFGFRVPVNLPDHFYRTYLAYLTREHPSLARDIDTPEKLRDAMIAQSTGTSEGFAQEREEETIYRHGRRYHTHRYFRPEKTRIPEQTFYALGQLMFTDALAAIKLHLIARLMNEGHIEKGPIIDYEGVGHLSSKQFFLRYPEYALEVVLRTVNELMAGKVEGGLAQLWRGKKLSQIGKILENPDWAEVLREIVKVPLYRPEDAPEKSTELGPNQRQLLNKTTDVLELLNLDPHEVMPSDEEIAEIRKRLQNKKIEGSDAK